MRVKLSAADKAMVAKLKGKTIASVALFPWDPNRCGTRDPDDYVTSPVITFTDGTRLRFVTEETEGSEYGTALVLEGTPKVASVVRHLLKRVGLHVYLEPYRDDVMHSEPVEDGNIPVRAGEKLVNKGWLVKSQHPGGSEHYYITQFGRTELEKRKGP